MKIINEKGRLFGIINVVDLAVIIVVVLAVFAVAVKMTGGNLTTPIADTKKNITVTLKATSRKDAILTAFKKGDKLVYGNDYIKGAVIDNVELTPTIINVQLPTGEIVPTPDPVYKDIMITFTAPIDGSTLIPKVGNDLIRIGATFNINTQSAQVTTVVTDIKYEK